MRYDTQSIRNVVLLGHSGCGKTTFAETMLFEAKGISRRGSVADKSTVSDFSAIEQERGSSIFSTLLHADWKDCKINIMDTPGADDFVGEVISSMKVADTALMLLNAKSGVEVGTELIWEYVETFKTPCLFVVNHLDHEKADYEITLEQARERFGKRVLPVQYPLNAGTGFNAIVDALRMVMYVFPATGGKPEKKPIPDSEMPRAQEMHNLLVEAAAENDENLMEHFFETGNLSEEELAEGLRIALANQQIFPLFCAAGVKNMGSGRIMGFIHDIAPSPADRPEAALEGGKTLACTAEGKPNAFIFKTMSEPNVGNVSYFKVYSGVLRAGDDLTNHANGTVERFTHIYVTNGKNREQVEQLGAGDIGVTVKLKNTHTNNTLGQKGSELDIEHIHFPEPRIRMGVKAPDKNAIEKLSKAMHIIHEEDPTLIVEHSAELHQILMHGQGQMHLDLVKYRIEKIFGVQMEFEPPRIPYRETITKSSNEQYRHKKQSGGAGQFAEVHIRIEPYHEGMANPEGLNVRSTDIEDLPWGGKLAFLNCVVGGTIDTRFMSAIKKGVMSRMEAGPLTGSRCRDIRISVYDGKMHAVDSNDAAFQTAGRMAFKQGFEHCSPQLLEPVYNLEVLCADESTGDVMGDLQTRRAMIVGMGNDGHYQKISARIPLAELTTYSTDLRSITQGKAKFHISFAEYGAMPPDVQQKLVAAHKEHLDDEA